jgi:hypothetical protein
MFVLSLSPFCKAVSLTWTQRCTAARVLDPARGKFGGGYGFFNTLNNSKNVHKNKVCRQPKKRPGDTRQFSR